MQMKEKYNVKNILDLHFELAKDKNKSLLLDKAYVYCQKRLKRDIA